MSKLDFTDSQQIDVIFQEAVDKAIAKHQERGESMAIADKNGKVCIIAAEDINRLQLQKIKK